jgi:hypothetical protein
VEREIRAKEAEEAAAQAAAQAAAAAQGESAADAQNGSAADVAPGNAGVQPKIAGTAVAKGASSAMAADPAAPFADPDALGGAQNPFSPEGAQDDDVPPKPLRNPKR